MKVFGGHAAMTVNEDTQLDRDLKKLLHRSDKASWVIQVTQNFETENGRAKVPMSMIQVFKATSAGFGAADQIVRWCAKNGCMGLVPDAVLLTDAEIELLDKQGIRNKPSVWPKHLRDKLANSENSLTMCPRCSSVAPRVKLPDGNFWRVGSSELAATLDALWQDLDGNADFYFVRNKETAAIHKSRALVNSGGRHGMDSLARIKHKKLLESERDRVQVHYRLATLLKDIEAGRTVKSAIEGLLRDL